MNITCPHCKTKLNLPDDKILKDRNASFKCLRCRESVPIRASQGSIPAEPLPGVKPTGTFQGGDLDQALVCMSLSNTRERVAEGIQQAGFFVDIPENSSQALKQLEYRIYPLIVVDEAFDRDNKMAGHLIEMDMSVRRKICLVKICSGVETGNAMAVLHSSVNFVIQARDLEQGDDALIREMLVRAMADHNICTPSITIP
ncbi:MAG: zinc-ribbon domain-containing protein [Desulfobacter sp.]|nr:zinc-ribbon domain-containing protein [Desulfobacter sp.]